MELNQILIKSNRILFSLHNVAIYILSQMLFLFQKLSSFFKIFPILITPDISAEFDSVV